MEKMIAGMAIAALAASAQGETVNFDDVRPGTLPPGWISGVTGRGTAHWSVELTPLRRAPARAEAVRVRRLSVVCKWRDVARGWLRRSEISAVKRT